MGWPKLSTPAAAPSKRLLAGRSKASYQVSTAHAVPRTRHAARGYQRPADKKAPLSRYRQLKQSRNLNTVGQCQSMQEATPRAIEEADHLPSHKMVESSTATGKSSVVTFGGPKKSFDSVVEARRDKQLRPAHARKPATPRPLHSSSGGPVANLQPPAPKTPRGAVRAEEEASSSLKTF